MSLNHLLTGGVAGQEPVDITVRNLTVLGTETVGSFDVNPGPLTVEGNEIITGNLTVKGNNTTPSGAAPNITILNTAADTQRATLNLAGTGTGIGARLAIQQDNAGHAILQNFSPAGDFDFYNSSTPNMILSNSGNLSVVNGVQTPAGSGYVSTGTVTAVTSFPAAATLNTKVGYVTFSGVVIPNNSSVALQVNSSVMGSAGLASISNNILSPSGVDAPYINGVTFNAGSNLQVFVAAKSGTFTGDINLMYISFN